MRSEGPFIIRIGSVDCRYKVLVAPRAIETINQRHFRKNLHAGEFTRFPTLLKLLLDYRVRNFLHKEFSEIEGNGWPTTSVRFTSTLEYPCIVGYVRMIQKDRLPPDTTYVRGNPTTKSTGLFVSDLTLLPPQTNKITFSYITHPNKKVSLWNVFPGEGYTGYSRGDLTEQYNVVFFDWDHPAI